MNRQTLIEAKNIYLTAQVITKQYTSQNIVDSFRLRKLTAKRRKFPIIDNVSLSIKEGDRIALTGKNGAGKTSLLRLLAGVYKPDRGIVSINDNVGGLFSSNVGLNPKATGFENIRLRCYLLGIRASDISRKTEEVKAFSELGTDVLQRPVQNYSTGMKLRLNTALTFLKTPKILMMDEWIGAGDKTFKTKISAKMEVLLGETSALVIATHSKRIITELNCTEVLLENGRIMDTGA